MIIKCYIKILFSKIKVKPKTKKKENYILYYYFKFYIIYIYFFFYLLCHFGTIIFSLIFGKQYVIRIIYKNLKRLYGKDKFFGNNFEDYN